MQSSLEGILGSPNSSLSYPSSSTKTVFSIQPPNSPMIKYRHLNIIGLYIMIHLWLSLYFYPIIVSTWRKRVKWECIKILNNRTEFDGIYENSNNGYNEEEWSTLDENLHKNKNKKGIEDSILLKLLHWSYILRNNCDNLQ